MATRRRKQLIRIGVTTAVFLLLLAALYFAGIRWQQIEARFDGYVIETSRDGKAPIATIVPESPATVAGLQVGDEIITINGVGVADILTYPGLHPVWRSATQQIVLEREGVQKEILLQTAEPISSVPRLTPLLIPSLMLLWIGFALFLWLRQPYDSTVLLFTGCQLAFIGFMTLQPVHLAFFYVRGVCAVLAAVFLFHLHVSLGDWDAGHWLWRFAKGLYGVPLVALVAAIPLFLQQQAHNGYRLLLAMIFLLIVVAAAAVLVWGYVRGAAWVRRRLRIIVAGSILAACYLVFALTLPFLLQGQDNQTAVSSFGWMLFLLPLSYGIAIYREGFVQLERVFNRAIVHLLILFLLITLFALTIRLLPTAWTERPLIWGGLTLLIATLFAPLRERVGRFVDRAFYGGWYDYRSIIDEMSDELNQIVSETALGNLLVERLAARMRLEGAVLFLTKPRPHLVQRVGTMPERFGLDVGLQEAFLAAERPFFPAELPNHTLPETISLLVPLIHQAELLGVLLLGKRIGGNEYDEMDRQILSTLANQTAVSAANVQLLTALQQRVSEINQLYEQLLDSRELERKRLARELHDQTIQDMINLRHALRVSLPTAAPTEVAQTAAAMETRMQHVIDDLRLLCTDLRPPVLDMLGLASAIQALCHHIEQESELEVCLTIEQQNGMLETDLPEAISIGLYRVFQEAVANVRRHAQANQLAVTLLLTPLQVTLTIHDNGCGLPAELDLSELLYRGHFGLAGMQERVQLLGGVLQLASENGGKITAVVPLNQTPTGRG